MTKLKEQAANILWEMPDDKVNIIIEIMKGLQALYNQNEKNAIENEVTDSARVVFLVHSCFQSL